MIIVNNIDIPNKKAIYISLRTIYGIGPFISKQICKDANIDIHKKAKDLTNDEIARIVQVSSKFTLNENLKKERINNIQKFISIKCNKGMRHIAGYPVRGQNTKSNAITAKKFATRIGGSKKSVAKSNVKRRG